MPGWSGQRSWSLGSVHGPLACLGANRKAGPEILDRFQGSGRRHAHRRGMEPRHTGGGPKRLQSDPDQYVRDGAIQGIRAEATDTPLLIR